jgi:hypothetical protein
MSATGGTNAISTRGGYGACFMQVYLDGIPMQSARSGEPFDISYLPPPNQIAAMEVYSGSSEIPLSLPQGSGGRKGCGAILVWTTTG